ncbi:MAG: NUDIX domain-containing protein [Candidatus Saccharibacteria bacterium]
MPHIHTEPGQHDMTISAYVVRLDSGVAKVLVHMHRKFGKLFQAGGHIELDETPWKTVAHEVAEETGYALDELSVLQPTGHAVAVEGAVIHPVPVFMNTHKISDTHYHSDLCYAFVAEKLPAHKPAEGESEDIRWLTLDELRSEVEKGVAAKDVYVFYDAIVRRYLPLYTAVPASDYSLDKPADMSF